MLCTTMVWFEVTIIMTSVHLMKIPLLPKLGQCVWGLYLFVGRLSQYLACCWLCGRVHLLHKPSRSPLPPICCCATWLSVSLGNPSIVASIGLIGHWWRRQRKLSTSVCFRGARMLKASSQRSRQRWSVITFWMICQHCYSRPDTWFSMFLYW